MSLPGKSWLTIRRHQGDHRDRLAAYSVLLDGEEIGSLPSGQCLERSVAPGSHDLRIDIGSRLGSEELHFTVVRGEAAEFECRPRPAWRATYDYLFERDRWVSLSRTGS